MEAAWKPQATDFRVRLNRWRFSLAQLLIRFPLAGFFFKRGNRNLASRSKETAVWGVESAELRFFFFEARLAARLDLQEMAWWEQCLEHGPVALCRASSNDQSMGLIPPADLSRRSTAIFVGCMVLDRILYT